jgi:hypothetical protein
VAVSAFRELYPVGRRGYRLKKPPAMRAITPAIAERERQRLISESWTCWNCFGPAGDDCWLLVRKMSGAPSAFVVCSRCVERVRRRRSGLRLRWFPPMEGQP